jgi:site-specific DNA recombinase
MTTIRAAIYTRISADQTGERLGVTRQLDDCLALADRHDWHVVDRFDDNDISAFNGKTRPGFEAMLDAMKTGQVDALICWHTDRLYRSMRDLERLIEIAEANRVQIRTVQSGELDLSTSAGRMMARILGSVARAEGEHKGERQKRANAQKATAGKWQTANRCFGYTMTGEPLEPEATAFRTAVSDVLNGKSIRAVAAEWNEKGLKTTLAGKQRRSNGETKINTGEWNSPRVRRLLMRPRYAGLKVHRGTVVATGDWTPLIDEDTHHGLVAFLSDKSRIKCTSFVRKYLGSGVYICGRCGGPMRAAFPGGSKGTARTYECKAHQHVVRRAEPLDEYIETLVLGYLSDPETRQRLAVMLHGGERINVDELHTQRAALSARLEDLAAMFAAGDIDGNQLRRGTNELRTQLAGVNQVLGELSRRSPVADILVADDPVEYWHQQSMDMKGKVLQEICTVTVQPARRGARIFDYDLLDIDWKA